MPNMTILAPKDGVELSEMLEYAFSLDGPCAIRYPKGKAGDLSSYGRTFMDGLPEIVLPGDKNAIVAIGSMAQAALEAAAILKKSNIETAVFNLRTVKPIAEEALHEMLKHYTSVLTLEDGTISGGVGMHIAAIFAQYKNSPAIFNLGWPDEFIPHGTIKELHKKYGLDSLSVANKAEEFFEKKA
jgi:1-deoxy-D-xylulose-5-phosphate synthase